MAKKMKSAEQAQPSRAIDMVPKMPLRHTIRIEKAEKGGYSVRHEMSHGGNYNEKLHVAQDKKALKGIIDRIV